ncbi:MAG TPA: hypothetical protein VFM53_13905 [Anaeromyxobacteraceae bacterium]|nr:hypothetical protein [Anaeromyxobacteraceae bacterium]
MTGSRALVAVALLAGAAPAAAQTMLDQEQRLIEINTLLLDLPPAQAPGAYAPGQLSLALELVGIPVIDGTTGGKVQITVSDRTRVYPRPRFALGLPAWEDTRAFVGFSYIPPISINGVSTNYFALEAGLAWTPGALAVGLRAHGAVARSEAPVTDPATRDVLDSVTAGGDLSAGWRFDLGPVSLTPYAGLGVVYADGKFTVTSDGYQLTSSWTGLSIEAGLRLLVVGHWNAVVEFDAYPGRLTRVGVLLGYQFGLWGP